MEIVLNAKRLNRDHSKLFCFAGVEVLTGTAAKCARGCSTGTLMGTALEDDILNVLGRLGVLLGGIDLIKLKI